MRRLTPDKISGVKLPGRERLGRGSTSLVYTTSNPNQLEVFTVEQMKLEYWQECLGIIDSYETVGTAYYEGFHRDNPLYQRLQRDVYHCFVQRLDMPSSKAHKFEIRAARKVVDELWWSKSAHRQAAPRAWLRDLWNDIYSVSHNHPVLLDPGKFVLDYDAEKIYPDFGPGDWAILDGQVVCIDPYHHEYINQALSLKNRRER